MCDEMVLMTDKPQRGIHIYYHENVYYNIKIIAD